jgi:hypothetical protein
MPLVSLSYLAVAAILYACARAQAPVTRPVAHGEDALPEAAPAS